MITPGTPVEIDGRQGIVLTYIPRGSYQHLPPQWLVLFGTKAERFTEEQIEAALKGDDD